MSASEQRSFPARLDCLAPAIAFAEAFCELHGIGHADAMRLRLMVEELFTNSVEHGHGGGSDAPVSIELVAGAAELALRFEDSAPPFDPLQHLAAAPPDVDADVDERHPGGLGVYLSIRLAQRAAYEYADGVNRIELVLRRRG